MNHQKNYIGFSKDASSSMSSISQSAVKDFNANISAVKEAATAHMLDTIVFVNRFGDTVTREITNSNPHVLKPLTSWEARGWTAMYDGIGDLITQMESVPDANNPNVSFLIMATTDGEENASCTWTQRSLADKIERLQATGRWTFVLRVPKGYAKSVAQDLSIPLGNVQEWDQSARGVEASTQATSQAMNNFYATRATGAKSSNVFYTSTSAVDTSALVDISAKTSLYVVDQFHNGAQIRDFILSKRTEYLIGAAFYQLTKTEPRVSPSKLILIRHKTTGKVYAGPDARKMLGLDTVNNARIHPNHGTGEHDIFIQSESVNRKLVAGTGVLYWAEKGRPVTQADLERYAGQKNAPAVPQLAQAPSNGKPTPSPVAAKKIAAKPVNTTKPVAIIPNDGGRARFHTPPANAAFYGTRDMARAQAVVQGKKSYDAGPTALKGQRYYVV